MAAFLIALVAVVTIVWRERTWRRTAAELRTERDQSRAELHDVSGLARDLRSPLQGVIGNTELMMAIDAAAASAEELHEIRSSAARAADIVRTIAAVTETSTLSRRWQDLNDIVARALASCQPEFAVSGRRVDFERSPRLPLVYVDGRQLERALAVLLHGPSPRTAPRQESGAATLRTKRREDSDDRLVVEFDDRASAVETAPLTDAAACRRIVEAHGGSLEVVRPSRGGYRFVLELPVWTM